MEMPVGAMPVPDAVSAQWVASLSGAGPERERSVARLHEMLLRAAARELARRHERSAAGPADLDDLARQAARDALLAILARLGTFRGESRFTTWAYRFVVLEVSKKMGRHYCRRHPELALDAADWSGLPARIGLDPAERAAAELASAVRQAAERQLTDYQRRVFAAVVLGGVPLDAVAANLGVPRSAIYTVLSDARRKIRAALVADGHLVPSCQ